MKIPTLTALIIMTIAATYRTQEIRIHDLNNNNGYTTLELEDVKIIRSYHKILHIINTTEFDLSKEYIKRNVLSLQPKAYLIGPMYNSLNQSLFLLEAKIENIKPQRRRQKRGLANILGTGLKYIAGTMDHDDEVEIKAKLDELHENNGKLIEQSNKQVSINNELFDQIQNITTHINNQQSQIQKHLNNLTNEVYNKIITLEDEVKFMQYTFQINHDILLLRNHVDDIEQVLFSSKLGVLSKNILNEEELKFVTNINSYQNIKITVTTYKDTIVIALLIPQLSNLKYSKV